MTELAAEEIDDAEFIDKFYVSPWKNASPSKPSPPATKPERSDLEIDIDVMNARSTQPVSWLDDNAQRYAEMEARSDARVREWNRYQEERDRQPQTNFFQEIVSGVASAIGSSEASRMTATPRERQRAVLRTYETEGGSLAVCMESPSTVRQPRSQAAATTTFAASTPEPESTRQPEQFTRSSDSQATTTIAVSTPEPVSTRSSSFWPSFTVPSVRLPTLPSISAMFSPREEPIPLQHWPSLDSVSSEEALRTVSEIIQTAPSVPSEPPALPAKNTKDAKEKEIEEVLEAVLAE